MKVQVTYGPWLPTMYLRWNVKVLEQKMRRRVKQFPETGAAYTHYEFEWQPVVIIGLK